MDAGMMAAGFRCGFVQPRRRTCSMVPAAKATSSSRVAIIGAGFAGLGVCWNLLKLGHAGRGDPSVEVDVYDAHGVGSGASAVAAGLLHPLNTRGNVTWRGVDAMNESLGLLREVEVWGQGEVFYRQTGVLKRAKDAKDIERFERIRRERENELELRVVRSSTQSLPGFIYTPSAYAVDSPRYLESLRAACEGRGARFRRELVRSLKSLRREDYSAVVICAGAAVGTIAELEGKFPLRLSETFGAEVDGAAPNLHMVHPEDHSQLLPVDPSLLGQCYVVGQPGGRAVLGALHSNEPVAAEDAIAGRHLEVSRGSGLEEDSRMEEMGRGVVGKAAGLFPGLLSSAGLDRVHCGVRALPPKSEEGRLPICGKLGDGEWYLLGLGARGLLYHQYLGSRLARAVISGDETALPEVTRRCEKK